MSVLTGKSVLVTGGAGSFGKAFVQEALDRAARRVVVFSRSESRQAEMKAQPQFNDERLRYFIGDVRDEARITQALNGIDILVHAAALKRVEVCEADPVEAIETNINGTVRVARAAIACGVSKALYLSTDKAAAPNTLYGATKLAGERAWNAMQNSYAAGTGTTFACTRYGNVIGSTGSVVPVWKAQAANGEPLTVTDMRCTRFFMSMREAVDLVSHALANMTGNEVFIPKIRAARISALAEAVAPGSTYIATGLRPGEKLHEVLLTEDEARSAALKYHGSMWVLKPSSEQVPLPFAYRSDNAKEYTVDELRALVAA